jgi:hypothetical protein
MSNMKKKKSWRAWDEKNCWADDLMWLFIIYLFIPEIIKEERKRDWFSSQIRDKKNHTQWLNDFKRAKKDKEKVFDISYSVQTAEDKDYWKKSSFIFVVKSESPLLNGNNRCIFS